jgi:hypothetical protein
MQQPETYHFEQVERNGRPLPNPFSSLDKTRINLSGLNESSPSDLTAIRDHQQCDFIKGGGEGAELEVIEGGLSVIRLSFLHF